MAHYLKIAGYVKLKAFDKYGTPLKREWQEFDNMITGESLLIDCLVGNETISYMGVGSGYTDPAAGDADLSIPIGTRKKITYKSNSSGIGLFSTYYATGDNNGDWSEAILATRISGAYVLCHALLDDLFEKDTTKRVQLDWNLELV